MADSQTRPSGEITTSLARELSLFDLVVMGTSMMIGAGAVLGMGHSVRIAGPGGVIAAFALNGLVTLLTAMAYAEMSSAIPRAGGIYNFARIAFGRPTGFMAGWIAWLASCVACGLYALLCGLYVVNYLGQLGLLEWLPLPPAYQERIVALAVAALFAYVNYRGVSETGRVQIPLILGQMLALAVIAAIGIVVAVREPGRLANFQPLLPHGWTAVLVCMAFEFVAFEGYEVIATAGDEAIDPRRNLPRAIFWSVGIVTATYLAVGFALIVGVKGVGMPAWQWLGMRGEMGFGAAVSKLMPFGALVATLTVLFASTSALNASIYSATRVFYALGRDRMLPGALGRISSKTRTPHVALLATTVMALAVAALMPILHVVATASMLFLLMFVIADLSVIRIRRTMGDELTYGYQAPLFPLLPAVAMAVQLGLAVYIVKVSWVPWAVAPAWMLVGVGVYWFYSRTRALPIREEVLTLDETAAPAEEGTRILVPLVDPEQALRVVAPVIRLAEAEHASVELFHIVEMPDQVPLSDAPLYSLGGREAIVEATLSLSVRLSVNSSVLYCRRTVRGILTEAARHRASAIILASRRKPRPQYPILGSTVAPVLRRAPCDVLVFWECGAPPFPCVLVPVFGDRSDILALRVASILADQKNGRVMVLHVAPPSDLSFDLGSFLEQAMPAVACPAELLERRRVVSKNMINAILGEAKRSDLVVMGTARQARWQRSPITGLAERIAVLCDKPLVIVRAGDRGRSLIGQWP